MPDTSDAAVRRATGHGWTHWFAIHDAYPDEDHAARVRRMWKEHGTGKTMGGEQGSANGTVSEWWCQSITVEWEKARGKRVEGQSSKGDFQVSCSKSVLWDPIECYERVVTTPFLAGADWTAGSVWETPEGTVEVRRADPGKMLRWFWHDRDGKSTVEVSFVPQPSGKTSIVFSHFQLVSLAARDAYRVRWKAALSQIVGG